MIVFSLLFSLENRKENCETIERKIYRSNSLSSSTTATTTIGLIHFPPPPPPDGFSLLHHGCDTIFFFPFKFCFSFLLLFLFIFFSEHCCGFKHSPKLKLCNKNLVSAKMYSGKQKR